jgi:hypothetical protein
MVHQARQGREENGMRLRRRRRRLLLAAVGIAYLLVIAWLASPVWRPAGAPSVEQARVSAAPDGRAIGVAPLARPKALPGRLPGSPTVTANAAEAGNIEPVSETGTEATTVVPEENQSSASSPPSSESSGRSHEETIIGFEG